MYKRQEQLGTTTARTPAAVGQIGALALSELEVERAELFAVIVNRADPEQLDGIEEAVAALRPQKTTPVWAIPEDRTLVAPSIDGILAAVDGRLIKGDPDRLGREALTIVVAGMSMVNVLPRLTEESVVVIPADRTEVLLATLLADASGTFPRVAGIILNGPFPLPEPIVQLPDGFTSTCLLYTSPSPRD